MGTLYTVIYRMIVVMSLSVIGFATAVLAEVPLLKVLLTEPPPLSDEVIEPQFLNYNQAMHDIYLYVPPTTLPTPIPIAYAHGDCSWLAELAVTAGWAVEDIPKLTEVALRESGCCPNRAGGDTVDSNCNITGVAERTHRSDTGLLQINGVHWQPKHKYYDGLVCREMDICTQEPLFDPLNNLIAGKMIFDKVGWQAWGE